MWEALDGCRLKILAAAEHMHRFEDAVDRVLKPNLDLATLRGEVNSQRTKYVFRVEHMRRVPARKWGIILGDAAHCYRSALDQLAHTFAQEPSNQTAFPICITKKEWVTKAPAQYWSIGAGLVRLMDEVQPYHRADPAAHPLAILRALSNLDKHRGIPTITLIADSAEAKVVATTGIARWETITFKTGAAYEEGAVVADCKIVPDDSGAEPHMDVEVTAAFAVAFGKIGAVPGLRNRLVSDVIDEVGQYVAKIMGVVRDTWNEAAIAEGAVDFDALAEVMADDEMS